MVAAVERDYKLLQVGAPVSPRHAAGTVELEQACLSRSAEVRDSHRGDQGSGWGGGALTAGFHNDQQVSPPCAHAAVNPPTCTSESFFFSQKRKKTAFFVCFCLCLLHP